MTLPAASEAPLISAVWRVSAASGAAGVNVTVVAAWSSDKLPWTVVPAASFRIRTGLRTGSQNVTDTGPPVPAPVASAAGLCERMEGAVVSGSWLGGQFETVVNVHE